MKRSEVKKIYEENGLYNLKLIDSEDLLRVHGVDFRDIDGYDNLDDTNKATFEEFIVHLFNYWGLETRATLIPKGIYLIGDVQYLVEQNPKDDYYIVCGKNTSCLLFKYQIKEREEWFRITKENEIFNMV